MSTRKITSKHVTCPRCGARPYRDCISERIPSCNTLGGGWGGGVCKRPHKERTAEAKARMAGRS